MWNVDAEAMPSDKPFSLSIVNTSVNTFCYRTFKRYVGWLWEPHLKVTAPVDSLN